MLEAKEFFASTDPYLTKLLLCARKPKLRQKKSESARLLGINE